ncbi:MAG: hypothetical protein Kow00108_15480 [Calditrichia bacterium]
MKNSIFGKFVIFILILFKLYAQVEEAELKAVILLRICQFTSWTHEVDAEITHEKKYKIGVIGDKEIYGAFRDKVLKQEGFNSSEVTFIRSAEQLDDISVLFIGNMKKTAFRKWMKLLEDKSMLIFVDDRDLFKAGGVVLLERDGDYIRFDVDQAEAQKRGLRISSRVLKLARSVVFE